MRWRRPATCLPASHPTRARGTTSSTSCCRRCSATAGHRTAPPPRAGRWWPLDWTSGGRELESVVQARGVASAPQGLDRLPVAASDRTNRREVTQTNLVPPPHEAAGVAGVVRPQQNARRPRHAELVLLVLDAP